MKELKQYVQHQTNIGMKGDLSCLNVACVRVE